MCCPLNPSDSTQRGKSKPTRYMIDRQFYVGLSSYRYGVHIVVQDRSFQDAWKDENVF